ncbi:hypothetical protein JCM3770_004487 [Rhodotorula araucariae]
MACTRAASPTVRALPQRERRPSTRYSPAEYAAAPPAAQTRRTAVKAMHSKTKTVKRRSGLADDRASTATGGNTTLRAKVLAAVLRLSRDRGSGESGVGHNSIRKYVLDHGGDASAKNFSSMLLKTKHALVDRRVLVHGTSAGNTVKDLCDVSLASNSDDEHSDAKPGLNAWKLTKAQLVAELERLGERNSERIDEVEDLREQLAEMSEVNQTWEARARVLGYRNEGEDKVDGAAGGEGDFAMEDARIDAQEDQCKNEAQVGMAAEQVVADTRDDIRIEEQDNDADADLDTGENAPPAVSPTIQEPDTELEGEVRAFGGIIDQPFIPNDHGLDAEPGPMRARSGSLRS